MKVKANTIATSLLVMMAMVSPSAVFAQTELGEAAATEVTLVIPQATIIGVAIIGVLGVILTVMAVIGLIKQL